MSNTERAGSIKVDLSPKNPFGLTFYAPDHDRSLYIEEPENFGAGTSREAQDLLRTVMLAHLVIRHFPKIIETNFKIDDKRFLDELYKHYGFAKPKVTKGEAQIIPKFIDTPGEKKESVRYANAHSGGLDSVYRVATLRSEGERVLMSHLRNLNPKGTKTEALASRHQAEVFGLPYEEIKLRNGTDNTGFAVMRTRDMFLALVTAMIAEPYKTKKVFIEGDMQTDPTAHFSEYAPAWVFFNKLIEDVGLGSRIEGMDAHDIETIREVLKLEKDLGIDILPLVQNCFTGQHQVGNNRRKWVRETPEIAENSPYHWCGSCTKCRRMTLGRLFYDDSRFAKVSAEEIKYFVEDTYTWLQKYPHNKELISESFMDHLDKLRDRVQ
jgi:hypothetical protein